MHARLDRPTVPLHSLAIAALVVLVVHPPTTFAQEWATTGADIHNTNSGNVGIGTTTPSKMLEVTGASKFGLGLVDAKMQVNHFEMARYGTPTSQLNVDSQTFYAYVDDKNVNLFSEQDETGGPFGGFIFNVDDDGTLNPTFRIQGKSGNLIARFNKPEIELATMVRQAVPSPLYVMEDTDGGYPPIFRFKGNSRMMFAGDDLETETFYFYSNYAETRQFPAKLRVMGDGQGAFDNWIELIH